MRIHRSKLSRLASWGVFFAVLFTVGTGFDPGSLTRSGCNKADRQKLIDLFTVTVVDDATSAPLAGAHVMLGTAEAGTDANGEATFRDLAEGAFDLSVALSGYATQSRSIMAMRADPFAQVRLTAAHLSHTMPLPVADISVFQGDGVSTNRREEPYLYFESTAITLAARADVISYIDMDLSKIPADAMLTKVLLTGHMATSSSGPPIGGGGPGSAPDRGRVGPRSAQDDDVVVEAIGVLQPWNQEEINFLNKPVDYTNDPVASGVIAASAPTDQAGLKLFTMDLTQFANRLRAGTLRAHGFVLTGREIVGTGGNLAALTVTSSDYMPADGALKIVAEYTDATGKTVKVSLR